MAVFSKAIPDLHEAEGGLTAGEHDHGGLTKYGISKRQFPTIDVAKLTVEEAEFLLETAYWDRYRCAEIKDQTVANQVFLLLINMNPLRAGKIVQKAVNACGRSLITVTVDGVVGSKTIEAINSLIPQFLSDRIRVEACRYYQAEADGDPKQIPNFRSWIRRTLL